MALHEDMGGYASVHSVCVCGGGGDGSKGWRDDVVPKNVIVPPFEGSRYPMIGLSM